MIAFTKSAAKELARDNVLVNCVAPAMVETELFSERMLGHAHRGEQAQKFQWAASFQIDEVGAMVSWIASPGMQFHDLASRVPI